MKNFPMKFSIFNAEKFLCIVHGQVFIMDCDIFKNFVFPYHGSPDLLFGGKLSTYTNISTILYCQFIFKHEYYKYMVIFLLKKCENAKDSHIFSSPEPKAHR